MVTFKVTGVQCGCRAGAGMSGMLGRIRRRQELRAAQDKARLHKVTLARHYRAGEMPGIQSISLESFLAPLGEPILQFLELCCHSASEASHHVGT